MAPNVMCLLLSLLLLLFLYLLIKLNEHSNIVCPCFSVLVSLIWGLTVKTYETELKLILQQSWNWISPVLFFFFFFSQLNSILCFSWNLSLSLSPSPLSQLLFFLYFCLSVHLLFLFLFLPVLFVFLSILQLFNLCG